MSAHWQMRHDSFGRPARLFIATPVRKTDDRICVRNIDPLRIGAGRIERDAEGSGEPGCKDRRGRGMVAVRAQYYNSSGGALGGEHIAVRRDANDARLAQSGRKKVDFEAIWDDWLLIVGSAHYSDEIPC